MKSTNKFIVSPKGVSNYVNEKEINGKTIIVNTSIENANDTNRIGIIKALPLNYSGNIEVGDEVVVQHNVFREYFDVKGVTRKSPFHITEDLFEVAKDLIFLIIKNGEYISVDDFCFIKPIFKTERWLGEVEQKHIGIVKFSNRMLEKILVFKDDLITFMKDSEYQFEINNEILYRMRIENILAKIIQ